MPYTEIRLAAPHLHEEMVAALSAAIRRHIYRAKDAMIAALTQPKAGRQPAQ